MLKLGITGGIGSGKSTVSQLFSLLGIPVYIADVESKKITATSPIIRQKLIEAFGEELYDGTILNKALFASYIFNDSHKLQIANNIIHPEVEKDFRAWVDARQDSPIVAHEAAILFESGLNTIMDKVVMVYAPLELRINRVMKRDNTSRQAVEERINNQMSDDEKRLLSDYVIINDDNHSLISQTLDLLNTLGYKLHI